MTSLGLALLRVTLAVVLVAHGAHDLFGSFDGPGVGAGGLALTAQYFESVGLTPGVPLAALASSIELLGGILIGIGWLTRWAAVAVIGTLAITLWKDHLRWGFFLNWVVDNTRGHGVEYSVVLIGTLVCLVLAGAGSWSIDGQRERSAASRAAGRARIRNR